MPWAHWIWGVMKVVRPVILPGDVGLYQAYWGYIWGYDFNYACHSLGKWNSWADRNCQPGMDAAGTWAAGGFWSIKFSMILPREHHPVKVNLATVSQHQYFKATNPFGPNWHLPFFHNSNQILVGVPKVSIHSFLFFVSRKPFPWILFSSGFSHPPTWASRLQPDRPFPNSEADRSNRQSLFGDENMMNLLHSIKN